MVRLDSIAGAMLLSASHIGTFWVFATLVIPQSGETAFLRGCAQIQGNNEYSSVMKIRCGLGKIIQIEQASLWRANSGANCQHINLHDLFRYTCGMISRAVQQRCHQQNNCQYTHTYPDWNDCPEQDYQSDRPIVLRIDFKCVSRRTAVAPAAQTDDDKTDTMIGSAVGGALVGILAIVTIVLVVIFVVRKRSRAKSASPGEPVTMENMIGAVKAEPNIYDYSGGFDDAVVKGDIHACDNPAYDNHAVGEARNVIPSDGNVRQPVINSKAADETVTMDNALYEGDDVDMADGVHE